MRFLSSIVPAQFPEHTQIVKEIFTEYGASLGIDLSFQGFESELAELPGKYAAPMGRVLLAFHGEQLLGCVALRPLSPGRAEIKRLYVRPSARGLGLGPELMKRVCQIAREIGYRLICLDTLPSMEVAQRLYETMGFTTIAEYSLSPLQGTRYMGKML